MLLHTAAALGTVTLVLGLLAGLPASAPSPHVRAPSDYGRHLLDHLRQPQRAAGERIMAGENVTQSGVALAVAAPGQPPTPGVSQNGVCNDLRPVRRVGETATFWVADRSLQRDVERQFTLAAVTDHVYMWVDTATYDATDLSGGVVSITSKAEAEAGAAEFERIYDIDRRYFGEHARCDRLPYRQPPRLEQIWGQPWYDADDDPHINIVNFPIQVAGVPSFTAGYYSSRDEYPKTVNATSNEGEFFYMNSALLDPGSETYRGVLAHEFYHMIQFANDANEESWVNEGMAMIAMEVNGFDLSGYLSAYAESPDDQLTHFTQQPLEYGNAYTFLSYLLEHYGPPDDPATAFRENYALGVPITRVAADGMSGLDEVLATNPYRAGLHPYYRDRTANDVYLDRGVANILNDRSIDAGQYGYMTLASFKIRPNGQFSSYPVSREGALHPFAEQYLVFDSRGDGSFRLEGEPTIPIVDNLAGMPSPRHELWLNRGDQMETFVVRAADLTRASAPTLRFGYWYDLEEDFDYVYLQVSEDGGSTWVNLDCVCGSRRTDPNRSNRGNGITGKSGAGPVGGITGATPRWGRAKQDLSAYVGRKILLRFLYDSDDAVNNPGFTLDNVSLEDRGGHIWPLETFEAGPGAFQLGGDGEKSALVIDPIVTNQLVLQLLKVGTRVEVERFSGASAGEVLAASGQMDAPRTIAIFTSLTPLSSETFDYRWDAEASSSGNITPLNLDDLLDEASEPITSDPSPANNIVRDEVEEPRLFNASRVDRGDRRSGLGQPGRRLRPWRLSKTATETRWD
ncbi:MAG: immune inhibitor A [Actinomycetota bacterium]|nr:immune inhibitor A [Actinomycetota bacterium]